MSYHRQQNKSYPSILAVANLLAHNNISQICYCGQISLQSAAVNCSFSDNLTPLGVTFILLAKLNFKFTPERDKEQHLSAVFFHVP